jgi:hypothetical protein
VALILTASTALRALFVAHNSSSSNNYNYNRRAVPAPTSSEKPPIVAAAAAASAAGPQSDGALVSGGFGGVKGSEAHSACMQWLGSTQRPSPSLWRTSDRATCAGVYGPSARDASAGEMCADVESGVTAIDAVEEEQLQSGCGGRRWPRLSFSAHLHGAVADVWTHARAALSGLPVPR